MSTYLSLSEVTTAGFDKAMKEFTKEVAEHGWQGRRTKQGHIIARAPDGETTMCITRSELRGRSDKNLRAEFNRWLRQYEEEVEDVEVPKPSEVFSVKVDPEIPTDPFCGDCGARHPYGTFCPGSTSGEVFHTAEADAEYEARQRIEPIYDDADDEMGEIVEQYAEEAAEKESEPEPEPEGFMCLHPGCARVFARERSLQGHKRKHTLKYENCPLCGRSVTYMGKHLRSSHNATVADPEARIEGRRTDPVDALEKVIDEVTQLRAENEELRTARDDALARLDLLREALNA